MSNQKTQSYVNALVNALAENMANVDIDNNVIASGFSLESDDPIIASQIEGFTSSMDSALAGVIASMESDGIDYEVDEQAAQVARITSLLASDPSKSMAITVPKPVSTGLEHRVVSRASDSLPDRSWALEHYDNRDMTTADKMIAYNMEAIKPSAFVKTLFPFVIFNPSSAGVSIEVEMLYRVEDARRSLDGTVTDFKRRNLTQAGLDSSILRDDSTRVIPVVNAQTQAMFVPDATIPNQVEVQDGQPVNTNFLKFNTEMELIALSQTATLLRNGVMDATDQLDTKNTLSQLAYQVGADILEFDVSPITSAAFTSMAQGERTAMGLNMESYSVTLNGNSTARGGAAFTEPELIAIGTNGLTIRMKTRLNGSLDINRGSVVVYAQVFMVDKIFDNTGLQIDVTDPSVSAIVAALNGATPLGWKIHSHRSNLNRRQRGRHIDTTRFREEYHVPLRSALSVLRPPSSPGNNTRDVAVLTAATHIDMANEAVSTLGYMANALRSFQGNSNVNDERPDYLGAGSYYMNPYFIERGIDLPRQINSITSHERHADMRAVLVMQMRDICSILYQESGMAYAQEVLYPGRNHKPTVKIATESRIAGLLYTSNGEALLGDQFDSVVVVNDNYEMRNRIYLLPCDTNEAPGTINPLGSGNTLYAPETLSNVVIERNGQSSRELSVMRHYQMIANSNLMGLIHVSGISEALGQICVCSGSAGGVNPNSDVYADIPASNTTNFHNHW